MHTVNVWYIQHNYSQPMIVREWATWELKPRYSGRRSGRCWSPQRRLRPSRRREEGQSEQGSEAPYSGELQCLVSLDYSAVVAGQYKLQRQRRQELDPSPSCCRIQQSWSGRPPPGAGIESRWSEDLLSFHCRVQMWTPKIREASFLFTTQALMAILTLRPSWSSTRPLSTPLTSGASPHSTRQLRRAGLSCVLYSWLTERTPRSRTRRARPLSTSQVLMMWSVCYKTRCPPQLLCQQQPKPWHLLQFQPLLSVWGKMPLANRWEEALFFLFASDLIWNYT